MPTRFKKFFETTSWIYQLVFRTSPKLIILIVVCQLLTTVLPFIEQKQLSVLIDNLIAYFKNNNLNWYFPFFVLVVVRIIKILFLNIYRITARVQQFIQDNELRKIYATKTSSLDYQQLEDKKIATLMSKVNEEYLWRSRQVFSDITELISQVIGFATVIYFLVPRYWYLALILMLGEIPSLIVDAKFNHKNFKIFEEFNEKTRFAWDIFWQLVDKKYTAELKINNALGWVRNKAFFAFDEFTHQRIRSRFEKFGPDILTSMISICVGLFCMFLVINDIKNGLISIGMFTFYFSIVRQTGDYFAGIFNRYTSISEQIPHINNFRKILELQNSIVSGSIKHGLRHQSPQIEFRNVSFKYPNSDRFVYRNLNLIINPQEEIAIVGPNGAGKSTLIKLICRFYDPTEGQILVNGIDLRQYNLDYWYKHLSLLTQEFNVYPNLSLKDNVIIGRPKITSSKRVDNALKKAEATDFVKKYENGINSMMSQRYGGEEPSWGQWQKIAIARSFYRDSPIMVLDEPTASIDAVAESKIFSRIFKEVKKKTLIIVSHRFSTVRNAQRIIVIDNGKVVEQGTHEKLIKDKGLYAQSFNLQAKGYN